MQTDASMSNPYFSWYVSNEERSEESKREGVWNILKFSIHLVHWMIVTLRMKICITKNKMWYNGIIIHINKFGCQITIRIKPQICIFENIIISKVIKCINY